MKIIKITEGFVTNSSSYSVERDDIILQIADLENQLAKLEIRKEKGEFVNDLINNNVTTLENLRNEEKELRKKRNHRFVDGYLYEAVWLIHSERKWTLKNDIEMWARNERDNDMRYLHECYDGMFNYRHYKKEAPKIFWIDLSEKNKDQIMVEIRKIIQHAIRCETAKVYAELFTEITTDTISLIIGAKSLDEALHVLAKDYIFQDYYDDCLDDSFVGNPENFDFWINNLEQIKSLKESLLPGIKEI